MLNNENLYHMVDHLWNLPQNIFALLSWEKKKADNTSIIIGKLVQR